MELNKNRILVVGPTERLRRRVASLLGKLPGIAVAQRASCAEIESYLAEHRIGAVLLEADGDFVAGMERIHRAKAAMPIVAYGDEPGYAATRDAFLNGALDVMQVHTATPNAVEPMLRRALDPLAHGAADVLRQREQAIRAISHRGQSLNRSLLAGTPPPFYMNGNRATLLRANVISQNGSLFWRQDAAWTWIEEFGAMNTFLFETPGNELRLGAIVEQDYVNTASFRRMLAARLDRFFRQIAALGCVSAATHCSSDYLSLSVLNHLDHLVDLVFYLDECQTIPDSSRRANTTLPAHLYAQFCAAVAIRDVNAAVACVDQAVKKLRSDMPAPNFAREALSRFLWEFASVVGGRSEHPSLHIDDSRICALRSSIVAIIRDTLSAGLDAPPDSPLDALIHRIEANPGLPLSIDQAAEDVNFSRSHFCRLFRQKTGQSFTAFLTEKRIELACDLLKKTGMRVDEISESVGIGNTWYFKKLFQKQLGVPLEEWLAENCRTELPPPRKIFVNQRVSFAA